MVVAPLTLSKAMQTALLCLLTKGAIPLVLPNRALYIVNNIRALH